MARTLSLYDTATGKGRVIRQGEIVQLVMDGGGAMVCAATEFTVAQKWAMSRTGSGNAVTDRGRFLDKIEVLISRPNSFISTRGSSVPLVRLGKAMKQAGYDLKEWNINKDVIEEIEKKIVNLVYKPKTELEADGTEAGPEPKAEGSTAPKKPE